MRVGSFTWLCLCFFSVTLAAEESGRHRKLQGYAEWWKGSELVVDGERVRASATTKIKAPQGITTLAAIPLGFEVKVDGIRQPDGAVLARSVEAQPNGIAMFEAELVASTQKAEAFFLQSGVFPSQPKDVRFNTRGAQVDRIRRIGLRLAPPYKPKDDFRFYVVDDPEWNAAAFPNGMVVVNQGLLRDMDDDEVAIVLGYEIAHATHEHSRRGRKRQMFVELIAGAGQEVAGSATGGITRAAAATAIGLGGAAASNGFSREQEDQADRVGLRYAYEGGFDVKKSPRLWKRFSEKYGDGSKATNFFFGNHSLSAARAANLEREIELNYQQPLARPGAGSTSGKPALPARGAGDAGRSRPR